MPQIRRIHLGVDFGTSNSKIVFRDYGAPGGERAILVLRDGSFLIPSRVCAGPMEFFFGDRTSTADTCDIYESVKMQAAAEVTGDASYYFGPLKPLPEGFSFADLAVLVVWFLISEGQSAVSKYLGGNMEGVRLGMSMGVPMAFYKHKVLRPFFLSVARRAWLISRAEGPLGPVLLIEKAKKVFARHPASAVPETPDYDVRTWIRSEAEAAMCWPFQSPAVAPGPYVKMDVGAGTSPASLYRIYGDSQTPKRGIAFFGATSVAVGMDAVDRAIADSDGRAGDCLELRGTEQAVLQSNPKALAAIKPVQEDIYVSYKRAWIETYRKLQEYPPELAAWRMHRMFSIGGGSLVPLVIDSLRIHPAGGNIAIAPTVLEPPPDLFRADGNPVAQGELPFSAVAYGLSNIDFSVPEALTPDEVPPMPERNERRERLDRDDLYAK
jgi:hypothetical protein